MLNIYTFVETKGLDFARLNSKVYSVFQSGNIEECFSSAVDAGGAVIMELTHPVYRYQNLFAVMENYSQLPTILTFYIVDESTLIYALSNECADRNTITELFLKVASAKYENILNFWYDRDEINSMTNGVICLRSERMKRDDYLYELCRGINKYELKNLIRIQHFDLREDGYYMFAMVIRAESDTDYVHHTELKDIYNFVGALLHKECRNILDKYYGGEVFFVGTRRTYIIANVPYGHQTVEHRKIIDSISADLTNALSTSDAQRYRSEYFKSATNSDEAFHGLRHLQSFAFFYKDEPLIYYQMITSRKRIPSNDEIIHTLGLLNHMIIYDTSNKMICSHIHNLFINIIKPSMEFSLFMFCYTSLYGTIYDKLTGGYHFTPDYRNNPTTNFHRSYIEFESSKLCQAVHDLQSNSLSGLPTSKNPLINSALEYIKANYMNEISLTTISESLNVSSVYLSQLFKKELGLSPIKFIINYRIDQAKRMLKETNDSIYAISIKSGFWEPKHFSKTFKRLTGMTPSQFRSHN